MMTQLDEGQRESVLERVQALLDREIGPALGLDGGGIEVVGIDDDQIVQVRFTGACPSCPSTMMTLTMGIDRAVRQGVPEVRCVEAIP
mgnify:CR=1 FL=1